MGTAQTAAKKAKGDTKPKRDFNAIGQLGRTAYKLADKNKAAIGDRLPAAFYTAMDSDITALDVAVPTVLKTKHGTVQLTAAQTTALASGYALAKGMRTTVKSHTPDKDVLLAWGVGAKVNRLVVKDVTASLQTIADRIKNQPAEAKSFDFTDDDTKAVAAALDAIKKADGDQESGRAAAPMATRDRNATARRILAAVKKIAGAGMRTFVNDPTTYANFEALVNKGAG